MCLRARRPNSQFMNSLESKSLCPRAVRFFLFGACAILMRISKCACIAHRSVRARARVLPAASYMVQYPQRWLQEILLGIRSALGERLTAWD